MPLEDQRVSRDDERRAPWAPHRGAAVLTLGILGVVVCFVCGIIAWVMGSGDLKAMAAGRMDPEGEGLTRSGMILGIVGTCLAAVGLVILVVVLLVGGASAARSGLRLPTGPGTEVERR